MADYFDFETDENDDKKVDARTIKELAAEHSPASLRRLRMIVDDDTKSGAAQVAAASLLLAYAHGKPAGEEPVGQGDVVRLSLADLQAMRARIAIRPSAAMLEIENQGVGSE